MNINHIHAKVRDLQAAIEHCRSVWGTDPGFVGPKMATVPFGGLTVIFDESEHDTDVTVGFLSEDCDADFAAAVGRGATPIETPTDRPWGMRAAYLRGPGAVVFELEQEIPAA